MPAPAVHQHQRVVGREPPQRKRTDDIGRVSYRLVGEVDRGRKRGDHLARFRCALLLNVLGGVDIHRYRELLGRGVPRSGAHDDIDGSQLYRISSQSEILARRLPGYYGYYSGGGGITDEAGPHRFLSGGYP